MLLLRRAELVSGVGVGLLCLLGIVASFFLPVNSYEVSTFKNGQLFGQHQEQVFFAQQVGTTKAIAILATLGVLAVMVMIAALQHVLHRLPIDLLALWGTAILLIGTVVLTHVWTNYLFQPCALMAIVCAVAASLYQLLARNTPSQ